jgi:hypothetical protein
MTGLQIRTYIHVKDLIDTLQIDGPQTRDELCVRFGWTHGHFLKIMRTARNELSAVDGAIPRPVAVDGYRYRLTVDWVDDADDPAISDGVALILHDLDTRLHSCLRDLDVAIANQSGRTALGKRLRRRRAALFGTIATIELLDEQVDAETTRAALPVGE